MKKTSSRCGGWKLATNATCKPGLNVSVETRFEPSGGYLLLEELCQVQNEENLGAGGVAGGFQGQAASPVL